MEKHEQIALEIAKLITANDMKEVSISLEDKSTQFTKIYLQALEHVKNTMYADPKCRSL